ncbi:hypothetical protein U472_09835 [Orenia metallireducens]|uniref:Uncharacterized protein n=1 Tax=Orenia metallireducens TaxID=1413210 RepID=A0A1C0A7U3_9FIRM|nr:hypothetical protein [Orenia metallireducens]OCL26302.1 hypothetical protein U472_09835 [Orenia metallireducens]
MNSNVEILIDKIEFNYNKVSHGGFGKHYFPSEIKTKYRVIIGGKNVIQGDYLADADEINLNNLEGAIKNSIKNFLE